MHDFRLATRADDADLRELTALPVPGDWIELSYRRDPDFFAALSPSDQVLLGRYHADQLAATAVRGRRSLYVNGAAQQVGYLGGLRIAPRFQGKNLLFDGFRLLRTLHEQDPLSEYLTTIVEGNALPRALLVQRSRPAWPTYHIHGTLLTLALETTPGPLPETSEAPEGFLRQHGPTRHFFPSHTRPQLPWISAGGAVAALRDLSSVRQTVVHRYHGALRWARPLVNACARLLRRPPFPAPGSPLPGAFISYWCTDGYRPAAFCRLLTSLSHLAYDRGFRWLYFGIMADDPHVEDALRFRHRLYKSAVYRVSYAALGPLDARPSYLELADL
jgi:hypothetical protein